MQVVASCQRLGVIDDHIQASASFSAAFAFDSPLGLLGPHYLACGRGDSKNQAVYFFLGRP